MSTVYHQLPTLATLDSGASASLVSGSGAGWNPVAIRTRPTA